MTDNDESTDRTKEILDLLDEGWDEDEATHFVAIRNGDIDADEFAAAWFRDISRPEGKRQERINNTDHLAYNTLQSAIWWYPELAWKLILQLVERAASEDMLADVGLWALEEFVAKHGDAFIDRVEEQVRKSPNFRAATKSIWFSSEERHLEERIRKYFKKP